MSDLASWQPCELPPSIAMSGHYVRLEPMTDDHHFDDLWDAYSVDEDGNIWAYLPYGPFAEKSSFVAFANKTYLGSDPMFHVLVDPKSDKALGVASLMRINATHGVIEVGHICLAPAAQRTRMSTEMLYLFGCRVFDELGYRRFEWKCNADNGASCRAAGRFGFTFEGIFRQAMVVKGANRDTAWYSILDGEWPRLKIAFESWLHPANFDDDGRQIQTLNMLKG